MIRMNSKTPEKHCLSAKGFRRSHVHFLSWLIICWAQSMAMNLLAGESGTAATGTSDALRFNVRAYVVEGKLLDSTNSLSPIFEKYTGTNISLDTIVMVASDLQEEYRKRGYPAV